MINKRELNQMVWLLIGICWCATAVSEEQLIKKQITIVRDITSKQNGGNTVGTAEKLNRLDNGQFIIEFLKLDKRAKVYYLIELNIDQYEQFLKRFKNENEWAALWRKLSPDEQKHIPPTLESQIKVLRDCYYRVSPKPFSAYFGTAKAKNPTDLAHWKKVYYEEGYGDQSPFLEDILRRKKLKRFNPC